MNLLTTRAYHRREQEELAIHLVHREGSLLYVENGKVQFLACVKPTVGTPGTRFDIKNWALI